ncbi:DUF4265 domain-containing protein [Nonomuraea sp. SYSU D8015]|uniref:DUF4265 domain-containing protein n=1 Tax=Nonomuraea sp. SYSU D8015 TaxID=2593644 RepID=UPI001CB7110A|nr:DUF4265 domain-containing protein [Nonomuraea sp. SYSU D8015]
MVFAAPSERLPTGPGLIKVWFQFTPPGRLASLRHRRALGHALETGTARVANVPFLQDGVAEGDVVRFTTDDGLPWACERVEASGTCTVRVLPVPDGPLGRSAQLTRALCRGSARLPEFAPSPQPAFLQREH